MTTAAMESFVMGLYPTKEWRDKVNRMPIEQIVAIYYNTQKRIEKKKWLEARERENERYFHQMTLDEYFSKGETK